MKKNDVLLLAGIALLIAAVFAVYLLYPRENGDSVVITVDGTVTKTLPINRDTTYTIKTKGNGQNTLEIKDGHASVTDANCPDKLCVHQKQIAKKGETIVCLPHKIVISVETSKQAPLDAVAN